MNDSTIISNLFWKNKIRNKKKVTFFSRAIKSVIVKVPIDNFEDILKISKNNPLSKFTIISNIFSFVLHNYFEEYQGIIKVYPSQLINLDRILLFEENENKNVTFRESLQSSAAEIKEAFIHKNYIIDEFNLDSFSNFSIQFGEKYECINDDISLFYEEIVDNITFTIFYTENYSEYIIESFLKKIISILLDYNYLLNKDKKEYKFVDKKEHHQLLREFNDTKINYPDKKTIVDLFEDQVEKTPENVVVFFEDIELTYLELNEKANQFANYLKDNCFIEKGQIIATLLPKSIDLLISLLTIEKLGCIYLPIDINYPKDRIDFILEDSNAKMLLSEFDIVKLLNINNKYISLKSDKIQSSSKKNLKNKINPDDIAYLIYTSGTTGKPKGVEIEHRSNINMSLDQINKFEVTAKDKIVWFASVAFDASISEIMMSLYSGATLCIPTEEEQKDKNQFISFLEKTKSTVVTFPPSYLELLSKEDLKYLKTIITAGESANPIKAKEIVGNGVSYYNAYGPTEYSVCTSIFKLNSNHSYKSVPIGAPISNTQVYILDEDKELVPIGVSGTLYVSGVGLSRGYLNKPELTAEKFVDNPFESGTKMYDTGDLARWLPDGNIEFLGRKDFQVKIRGYRIELGEIETNISQFNTSINYVVADAKEVNGEKVLVVYYTKDSETSINKTELREYLQNKLPEYMIPSFFVELEFIPLTPNGKIDRKSLPSVSREDLIRREYVAPRNAIEERLSEIWQDVLNIEKIGIHDDFYELGGHSLIVGQIINRINQKLGKTISYKTFFSNATIENIAVQLHYNNYLPILKAPDAQSYPLTASQNRLWILSQLEGGSLAYNMPAAMKFKGSLDIGKFEDAFKRLINRHEILRTYFKTNNEGEVQQYILPENQLNFKIIHEDYSLVENQEERVRNYLSERNREVFDLKNAPLIRASLIKLRKDEYVFFFSMHHIIGDGWTIELIIEEIIKTYNAIKIDNKVELPVLKIQYKDYALWINKELQLEKYKAAEAYWLNQFSRQIPVLDLPSFKIRPLIQTYNGDTLKHTFGKDFLEKLKSFCKENDVTLFMILMSGVNALLYRYTGQDDIIVGTPVAGREHPDLENQLGLFLNTIAIRTYIKEKVTFLDLIENQKETLLEAYDYQSYPFDELVNKLNLKRDTSRSALFDVLIVLQNQSQLKNLNTEELSDIEVSYFDFNYTTSQVDISFKFVEMESLHLTIEYNTDIYEKYLIEKMCSHFENLLTQLLENPLKAIEQIDYLTEREKQQLLFDFNDTEVNYTKDKTVIDLFNEQVLRTPNNIAVVFNETELTYRELDEESNQLATYLIKNYTIQPNDLVGIKLDRSEKMIISIFGILKSGAAYVPIDVSYPQERIDYIVKDANLKLCIDKKEFKKFKSDQNIYGKTPIQLSTINSLAYCIYTSGSTGNPKGVLNDQAGLYNRLLWMQSYLNINDKQKFVQKTPYTFDVSVWELILPFITGSTLVVAKPEGHKDAIYLQKLIDKEQITIIHFVPAMLSAFLENVTEDKDSTLLHILCSGEELPVLVAQDCKEKFSNATLHNLYGPTEASIDVTAINLSRIDVIKNGVSIGKPISNTKIYIVNDALKLQPFGVPGELLISGIQVARGYLNLPELTKDRFIADPFREGYNVYRTGDVAKWQADGSIAYLGRIDNQVKIRGNRIELGEIENAILEYGTIQEVVVIAQKLKSEKVLAAYTVSESTLDKTALLSFLQKRLPDYMVPRFYIEISNFPLTSSGKIDRKALPSISSEDIVRKEYIAPRNEMEKRLVGLWKKVLEVDNIGVLDNFFELGGHSLKAMKLIGVINTEFKIKLVINDLFKNIVLEDQAVLIENISDLYVSDEDNNQNNTETEIFSI